MTENLLLGCNTPDQTFMSPVIITVTATVLLLTVVAQGTCEI